VRALLSPFTHGSSSSSSGSGTTVGGAFTAAAATGAEATGAEATGAEAAGAAAAGAVAAGAVAAAGGGGGGGGGVGSIAAVLERLLVPTHVAAAVQALASEVLIPVNPKTPKTRNFSLDGTEVVIPGWAAVVLRGSTDTNSVTYKVLAFSCALCVYVKAFLF
jgi:hypothetical protein